MRFLFLLLLSFSLPAYAGVKFELTHGVSALVPIVVEKFATDGTAESLNEDIASVIRFDLMASGRFLAMDSSNDENYEKTFAKRKVRTYLEGSVVQHENGRDYQVMARLVTKNILARNDEAMSANTLWEKTYRVAAKDMRVTAHRIADGVYEKLFQEKGLSTHSKLGFIERIKTQKGYLYQLKTSGLDGKDEKLIYQSESPILSFDWKPDGKQFAISITDNTCPKIILIDASTGGSTSSLTECKENADAPVFSASGKRLAFSTVEKGKFNIVVMDLATKKRQTVTQHWSVNTEPYFAPDDKALLYTSGRSGGAQIYQYTFASKQTDRQTFSGDYNTSASISDDNQQMSYVHSQSGSLFIELMDLLTGNRVKLGQPGQTNESPSFAPNSKMLVYSTRGKGLRLSSVEESVTLPLPRTQGSIIQVAWSPYLS